MCDKHVQVSLPLDTVSKLMKRNISLCGGNGFYFTRSMVAIWNFRELLVLSDIIVRVTTEISNIKRWQQPFLLTVSPDMFLK